MLLQVH
jgi:hypothetical protein